MQIESASQNAGKVASETFPMAENAGVQNLKITAKSDTRNNVRKKTLDHLSPGTILTLVRLYCNLLSYGMKWKSPSFFNAKGRKRDSLTAAVPRFNSSNSTSSGFFVGSVAARMKIIPLRSTYPPPPSAPLSAPGAKVRWRRNVLIVLRQKGSLCFSCDFS